MATYDELFFVNCIDGGGCCWILRTNTIGGQLELIFRGDFCWLDGDFFLIQKFFGLKFEKKKSVFMV